jgi:hypothetical protein
MKNFPTLSALMPSKAPRLWQPLAIHKIIRQTWAALQHLALFTLVSFIGADPVIFVLHLASECSRLVILPAFRRERAVASTSGRSEAALLASGLAVLTQ